jgi:hypothetical protein
MNVSCIASIIENRLSPISDAAAGRVDRVDRKNNDAVVAIDIVSAIITTQFVSQQQKILNG